MATTFSYELRFWVCCDALFFSSTFYIKPAGFLPFPSLPLPFFSMRFAVRMRPDRHHLFVFPGRVRDGRGGEERTLVGRPKAGEEDQNRTEKRKKKHNFFVWKKRQNGFITFPNSAVHRVNGVLCSTKRIEK